MECTRCSSQPRQGVDAHSPGDAGDLRERAHRRSIVGQECTEAHHAFAAGGRYLHNRSILQLVDQRHDRRLGEEHADDRFPRFEQRLPLIQSHELELPLDEREFLAGSAARSRLRTRPSEGMTSLTRFPPPGDASGAARLDASVSGGTAASRNSLSTRNAVSSQRRNVGNGHDSGHA